MKTNTNFHGASELILEKAVSMGLAKSRDDALKMGAYALNREFKLVKDLEMALVERKILQEKKEMARKGERYLSEEEALSKYR